jgi:hypothetical protein
MISPLIPIAVIGLVCIMLLAALYWHWRVYSLYKSLDEVKRKFIYSEFSFQFQNPWFAKQLGGPMFRDELPPDLLARVDVVRQQMRYVVFGLACCIILIFGLMLSTFRTTP